MNVAIIGDSKTGKTYSLNTLVGCTVIFNLDPGGYNSLRRNYDRIEPGTLEATLKEQHPECIVIDYCATIAPTISDTPGRSGRRAPAEKAYKALIADINVAIMADSVANLVVDGLTGLGELVLNAILALNKRDKAIYEDWGQAIDKLLEIVSVCASACSTFVMLCHLQTDKDEITGRIKETPLVYGKQLPNKLMALFDNVFAAGYAGTSFFWVTKPQPLMQTIGSRQFDNLPERIHQNFADLFGGKARAITSK